jgi:hypothetical protein
MNIATSVGASQPGTTESVDFAWRQKHLKMTRSKTYQLTPSVNKVILCKKGITLLLKLKIDPALYESKEVMKPKLNRDCGNGFEHP